MMIDLGIRTVIPDVIGAPPAYDTVVLRCGCNATVYRDGRPTFINILAGCPRWHTWQWHGAQT